MKTATAALTKFLALGWYGKMKGMKIMSRLILYKSNLVLGTVFLFLKEIVEVSVMYHGGLPTTLRQHQLMEEGSFLLLAVLFERYH